MLKYMGAFLFHENMIFQSQKRHLPPCFGSVWRRKNKVKMIQLKHGDFCKHMNNAHNLKLTFSFPTNYFCCLPQTAFSLDNTLRKLFLMWGDLLTLTG